MRKAFAGFLVTALAAASTTPLCSGSAFAQQLPAQAAAVRSAPEAAASQSAQEPAGQAAANCPGHPDALGTSRVLALDPTEYPRIGSMQYPAGRSEKRKEHIAHAGKDQRRADHAHQHKRTHTSADGKHKKGRNAANDRNLDE